MFYFLFYYFLDYGLENLIFLMVGSYGNDYLIVDFLIFLFIGK